MKTILLTIALFMSILQADANMSWVDQKIDEIKPQRNGLNSAALAALKSPFIYIKSESKAGTSTTQKASSSSKGIFRVKKDMSGVPLTLQMILNTSAMINNIWYKENSDVRGYKLTQVKAGYVVLERKKKTIKLFIAKQNKNLNISTK